MYAPGFRLVHHVRGLGKNRVFPPVITVLMEGGFHSSGTKNMRPRGIDAGLWSCPGENEKNERVTRTP
jgi:hypothetical protein